MPDRKLHNQVGDSKEKLEAAIMGPEGSPYQVAMSCLGTLVTFPAGRSFQVGGFNSRALSPGASADEVLCCLFLRAKKEFETKSKFTNSNSKSHP